NLVVASHYALSGLSEFGLSEKEFVARHDKRLLRVHSDGPPLPSRPLHFENGPSVSWLIPLLLFARPRRIFLFGADGGSNPSFSKRPYFYYDDYDADVAPHQFLNRPGMISFQGLPRKLDEYNRRQHINAINGDRVIDFAFRSLEANFGIQVPPIFNVCPHSTHRIFPRIDIDDALAKLAEGRARSIPERRAKRASNWGRRARTPPRPVRAGPGAAVTPSTASRGGCSLCLELPAAAGLLLGPSIRGPLASLLALDRAKSRDTPMKLARRQFLQLAAGAAAPPASVRAQAYPSRPVKIIVGQAAGSASDIVARL